MAKKRRKEEEEEFQLPEFSEADFLRKEITSAKMILLVALLAIVAAVISYFLTLAGIVVVAFFAGLAVVLLLKYIPKMFGVDTKKLERKDWFGYGSTYFFAWLAIWVLVMNVPFSDVTPPGLIVFVNNNQVAPGDTVVITGSPVNITAKATDNAGISYVWMETTANLGTRVDMQQNGGNTWTHQISGATLPLEVTVFAEDINGHSTSVTFKLM
jgi:hypothetical protein